MVDARNDDRLMMIALQNNVDDWFSFLKIMIQKKKMQKHAPVRLSVFLCAKKNATKRAHLLFGRISQEKTARCISNFPIFCPDHVEQY